jgi:hypothetical protein
MKVTLEPLDVSQFSTDMIMLAEPLLFGEAEDNGQDNHETCIFCKYSSDS